ncbi:MAG: 50S ribosomal protein L17 [Bacteroidetes bacterium]|nr:50S ribosomal protein L17 [Bacteroidota bacterium]
MRHSKKVNHLGKQAGHRSLMLANMASSLIKHKKINTTVAKAKALRKYVEPLLTKAKTDSQHSRRIVFGYLQDKDAVKALFGEVSSKISDRPGGYTRILKTGNRLGDNAEMCLIELVDFNEHYSATATTTKKKSRRGAKKKSDATAEVSDAAVAEDAPVAKAPKAKAKKSTDDKKED